MMIEHIPKSSLSWSHLSKLGLYRQRGDCIEPSASTPEWVIDYLSSIRSPSRRWPFSYAKAVMTAKFARFLVSRDPALALKLGVGREEREGE